MPDVFNLDILGDERGMLAVIEGGRTIPFDIARVYYIFGTKAGVERGFHAHFTLRQTAICVAGSCEMILDDGYDRKVHHLSGPDRAIAIEPMIWHEMRNFSADAVLLVFADQPYDEADYIRDYDDFLFQVGTRA